MPRTLLLIGSGFCLGVLASVPASLLFLKTDAGQAVLRSYVIAQPQWPNVTALINKAGGTTGVSAEEVLSSPIGVRVPRAYAGDQYAAALNGILADIQRLATTSNELGPLLTEMNSRSLAGRYEGIIDLIIRAKELVADQRTLAGRFTQDISALAAANQVTQDATTKALTFAVLTAAGPVPQDLDSYLHALEQLLSGKVPSAADINRLTSTATTLKTDLQKFGVELNKLTAHITAYIVPR